MSLHTLLQVLPYLAGGLLCLHAGVPGENSSDNVTGSETSQ
jgi:hypothetical protein